MSAYIIGQVRVTDASWVEEYVGRIIPILEKYGAKYIARSFDAEKFEGEEKVADAVVIVEFPSVEQAKAWYSDPDYAPLIDIRQAGSSAELTLVDGL